MLVVLLAVSVAACAVIMWAGRRRQHEASSLQAQQVMRAAAAAGVPAFRADGLESLPPPVARYLRLAVPPGRAIRVVRMRQVGTLRTDVRSSLWMPFEAEHLAAPGSTGFLWNARVLVAPLLHLRVRDAFIEGQGSGHVSLLSALTVASDAGTPEMNAGALHRFLAEAVWYPTALMAGPRLTWTAIDEGKALATLTDHGVTVSLEFRFADTGEVAGIYTPARWGRFAGAYEQRPWEGHFRKYERRDGLLVPTEGDVGWYVDGAWHPVWRGTITAFEAAAE